MKLLFVWALMLMAGCRSVAPVKVQPVEVPVEVMVPIRSELTAKVPKPSRPPNRCRDAKGRPTLCNRDLADWLNAYDAALDKANGKLHEILGLQPKGP